MSYDIDPTFDEQLERDLAKRLKRAGETYAAKLDERLARGKRSGRQYRRLPYQSSAPSEYPQEQSGALREGAQLDGEGLEQRVAIYGENEKKIRALELGYKEGNLEARKPVARTMEDESVQRDALEAMKGE